MATVREVTFSLLRRLGISRIFGNPVPRNCAFLRDFPADFQYVLGLQESVVVGMADGYAQATHRAALVNLHSAVGVGHAMGNIFTAFRNRTPLVMTAGQQSRSLLQLDPFLYSTQATRAAEALREMELRSRRVPPMCRAAIARAYHIAMQPPCGPTLRLHSRWTTGMPCRGSALHSVAAAAARGSQTALAALARALAAQPAAGVHRRCRGGSRWRMGCIWCASPKLHARWCGPAR